MVNRPDPMGEMNGEMVTRPDPMGELNGEVVKGCFLCEITKCRGGYSSTLIYIYIYIYMLYLFSTYISTHTDTYIHI